LREEISMPQPVLVIHGVANRSRERFEEQVERLAEDAGAEFELLPVFWGDIAAETLGVDETIPRIGEVVVRSLELRATPDDPLVMTLLAGNLHPARVVVRSADSQGWMVVADAAATEAQQARGITTRAPAAEDIRREIADAWEETTWLKQVEDEEILAAVGRAVGQATVDEAVESEVVRGPGLPGFVRNTLRQLDEVVGAVVGNTAGRLNQYMRTRLGPGITEFLGDIFVYQRHRERIHQRVREVLRKHAPNLGEQENPVSVAGHSLGGVIAFDLAVAGEPQLWTNGLVTFGSQSPFFHVLDPRGDLAAFRPDQPVPLPPTIPRWTNLWEPLDVLAFIAGKVFRLTTGKAPTDQEVPHRGSFGLWTHSAYWAVPELVDAIRATFAPISPDLR
jgi:hypothetical protein